jgi:hypothetical protein
VFAVWWRIVCVVLTARPRLVVLLLNHSGAQLMSSLCMFSVLSVPAPAAGLGQVRGPQDGRVGAGVVRRVPGPSL